MTETVPERVWLDENSMDCDGFYLCEAEKRHVNMEHEYVPATALEAAQARIQALEDTLNIERALSDGAHRRARAARREALEEVEKAFIAECVPGERRPLSSILDTIRALMENPNGNG